MCADEVDPYCPYGPEGCERYRDLQADLQAIGTFVHDEVVHSAEEQERRHLWDDRYRIGQGEQR